MATTELYIGAEVLRKEDPELVTGQASFIDNHSLPGMLWMAMVRPPYVHARVNSIDTSAAASMPGVVGVYTAADLDVGGLPFVWPITEDIKIPVHYPLTKDKIRFHGDAVAVVLAETRREALDAAENVSVDVTELPAVIAVEDAMADGAPLIHEELDSNVTVHWSHGGAGDQSLFESAPVIVEEHYHQPRLIPNAIEPRGCLASSIPSMGEFTLWSATQIPHIAKVTLSGTCGIPEEKLRVIAPDVGGSFGSKLNVYAEEALALTLARVTGRPVKWIEERSENYVATIHGRGVIHDCTLAGTPDGTILGLKFVEVADMGAYYQLLTPGIPELGGWVYMGPYNPQAYWFEFRGVLTNTTPTDAYRGAGRPEATYVIERTMDALADELQMDRLELRRKNFISEFPFTLASGLTIDSGDYHASLDKLVDVLDLEALHAEQAKRRENGGTKQLGVGFSTYNEMCGLAPSRILGAIRYAAGGWEQATIRFLPTGSVQVVTGTSPHGQGHETAWAQIAADRLGVDIDEVEVLHGDTAISHFGLDSYGSRSLAVGGVAVWHAGDKLVEKARQLAAHELEASPDDLEYANGSFTVKGSPDKEKTLKALAFSAWAAHDLPEGMEPGLEATATYDPPNFSWPGGAHAAVVEVDPETGDARLVRYVAVDDVGTVVNPTIVDGQVHGGITQGISAALYEEGAYDEEGNLQTANLLTYLVPSAAELPSFELERTESPSPTNPLGVKGVGETGTIAAAPAVINAVLDALSHLGVKDIQMPATPERVWRAIQEAKS